MAMESKTVVHTKKRDRSPSAAANQAVEGDQRVRSMRSKSRTHHEAAPPIISLVAEV